MNPKAVSDVPFAEPLDYPIRPGWAMFFDGLVKGLQPLGGTTAQRPTSPILHQPYFDTTLAKPVWCKQVTPSVAWVDATGASV